MRAGLLLLVLLGVALPASAQWQRMDRFLPVAGTTIATNLVGADDAYTYATVLTNFPTTQGGRFVIIRSPDDGASWERTFSGYNANARGAFLGDLDGRMHVLVNGSNASGEGQGALLLSDDHGATWAETPARIPSAVMKSVARVGETYVVVGGTIDAFRSTDGGTTWDTLPPMEKAVAFGGRFYALNLATQLFVLEGDSWVAVPFGATFAQDLWVSGGQLWLKTPIGAPYSSGDGATWAAQPTATPTTWTTAIPAPETSAPWLITGLFQPLQLTDDDGATATDITANYPLDVNGNLCGSNYAITPRAVIGNAWACFNENAGLYRSFFGPPVASGPLDPTFGFSGRTTVPVNGTNVAALLPVSGTSGASGRAGGGAVTAITTRSAAVRVRPDGTWDMAYGYNDGTRAVGTPGAQGTMSAGLTGDGGILAFGFAFANNDSHGVWRLGTDGRLDESYGANGYALTSASSGDPGYNVLTGGAQADGSAVVLARVLTSSSSDISVIRLTAAGALDPAFGTGGIATLPFPVSGNSGTGLEVDTQGRVLVADLPFDGTTESVRVVRLTAAGALDTSFGTGGVAEIAITFGSNVLTVFQTDPQDRPVVAGRFTDAYGMVMRLTASGEVDASFGTDGLFLFPDGLSFDVTALAFDPDGALIAAGAAELSSSEADFTAFRLDARGVLDASWGAGAIPGLITVDFSGQDDRAGGVLIDAAGGIVVAGEARDRNATNIDLGLVRLVQPTGTPVEPSPLAPTPTTLLDIWPNPSRGGAMVRLRTGTGGIAEVDVFDTLGRRVARLQDGPMPAGEVLVAIPSGLAPGVYVVRVTVDGRMTARALTVVR